MLRRAFLVLFGTLALAACGSGGSYGPAGTGPTVLGTPAANASAHGGSRVAILLPLSGPRADIGQAMLQAAQLALPAPDSPPLSVKDTRGTPEGAAAAAQQAMAEGVGIILGPLTSAETAAVAPIARNAGVPVLAFTNDPSQAQPGVWTLGITPGQQIRRLLAATQAQGKTQFAALLPDTEFGRAMGDALTRATTAAGLPAPDIRTHAKGMAAINAATRDLSGYANRRGPIDAKIKAARALNTPEGRREAQELARSSIPPAPFNALLLADTGEELAEVAALLPYYDIDRGAVQVIGPAIWASPASGSGAMTGAWYAAPDPAARSGLEQGYAAKFNTQPSPLADLAFDAASIARVVAGQGGYSIGALSQPAGFLGVDGWIGLLPDGQVRRGLAVFRVERGGPTMIEPAPQSAGAAGT
ncbi:MAG: penicillin-binding protein activator [Rhodospirillales bacterium]|nr:penicillin-binding protein activator [Rhodospirillales bacterium]